MILFSSSLPWKIHHTLSALKMTFSCILHFTIWHMTAYFRLIKMVRYIRSPYTISVCVIDRGGGHLVLIQRYFFPTWTPSYPATHHDFKNLYWNRWLCHSLVIITHWTILIPLRKDDCISVMQNENDIRPTPQLMLCCSNAMWIVHCTIHKTDYTQCTYLYLVSELMYFWTETLF